MTDWEIEKKVEEVERMLTPKEIDFDSLEEEDMDLWQKRCKSLGIKNPPSFSLAKGDFEKYWWERFIYFAGDKELALHALEYKKNEQEAFARFRLPALRFGLKDAWLCIRMLIWIIFCVRPIVHKEQPYHKYFADNFRFHYWRAKNSFNIVVRDWLSRHAIPLAKTDYKASIFLAKHPKATRLPMLLEMRYAFYKHIHKLECELGKNSFPLHFKVLSCLEELKKSSDELDDFEKRR